MKGRGWLTELGGRRRVWGVFDVYEEGKEWRRLVRYMAWMGVFGDLGHWNLGLEERWSNETNDWMEGTYYGVFVVRLRRDKTWRHIRPTITGLLAVRMHSLNSSCVSPRRCLTVSTTPPR